MLLPKGLGLDVDGGLLLEPKSTLPAGLEVFEEFCLNVLLELPLVAGEPKEKVGTDLEGSDMVN